VRKRKAINTGTRSEDREMEIVDQMSIKGIYHHHPSPPPRKNPERMSRGYQGF